MGICISAMKRAAIKIKVLKCVSDMKTERKVRYFDP